MQTLPYGSWPSPLTPEATAAAAFRLDEVRLDDAATYWLEGRPHEGGRVALVRDIGDGPEDVLEAPWNVRSRVHEMGGECYVVQNGTIVFSHFADNRLYRLGPEDPAPVPITPESKQRYGGLVLRGADLLAVREDHATTSQPRNELVRLTVIGDNPEGGEVLVTGTDFVARPAVTRDGDQIAWVAWNHPNMPWDSTTLWTGTLDRDGVDNVREVAGGEGISVAQPAFADDGTLWFISDATGWWNLWREVAGRPEQVVQATADLAEPQWVLGMRDYALLADGRLLLRDPNDVGAPALLDPTTGELVKVRGGAHVSQLVADADAIGFLSDPFDRPSEVVRIDRAGRRVMSKLEPPGDAAYVPVVEEVTWTNSSGLTAYGFFYPPTNPEAHGPEGELPPLLVLVHGGPTGRADPSYSPARQFWTSRGFAILDVNHGGSVGFGRDYRERLLGGWGVVDNDDIVTGALAMAEQGRVDADRLAIRGGSAGGYATLRALTTSDAFAAGTSYFGISDLRILMADTHKFESRYPERLIGPWPEAAAAYDDRSPVNHLDDLHGELLMLQGADDLIVPLSQANAMAEAMRSAGKDVELVVYQGEGHGFRRAESNVDALNREVAHYGRVFGFEPA